MAQDIIKPTGATKASKNDAGGGVIRSEPVVGIVKNNIDPIRAGRIQVYIQDINGFDPNDSKNWVTVRFLSPFYGRSYPTGANTGYGNYASNPVSYGEWHSPPEVGTQVICIFVNGDMNYGYYIGCIPEPEALTMVPAIGAVDSKVVLNSGEANALAGATQLPVTNLNVNNTAMAESSDFLNSPKPVHSYVAGVLAQQGLIRDPIRGPITSSAQRETPSRVGWGVSTPGRPIYEGGFTDENIADAATTGKGTGTKIVSRRAGHTFVMDDGDLLGKDQLIRLRTALGHQILMSDDGQCLFIIHANGQSWIELGKEGTIDMFATNSVNIRTQGDLNLHADNNININAEKNLNINAKENIKINSDKETAIRTGTDFKHHVLNNFTTKVGAGMSMGAGGEGSYASGGTMFVNGSRINLNTGQTSLSPPEVKPIPLIAQTDTLFDSEKGFAPAPAKLQTIVSRAPAHQPWVMANKGVDVKVNANAGTSLPQKPSAPVDSANNAAPSLPENPTNVATTATVPNVGSVGSSIDAGSTAAMVSAVSKQAGVQLPSITSAGSVISNGIAKVGQLAQTPAQLVTGGTLKPGSETLINGLVSSGMSVQGAMTNNMFTGQGGVTSVQGFINNATAQVQSQVTNFTKAQTQLINAGIITGKENPGAIAGVIVAGAQNGLAETANFIKTASGSDLNSLATKAGSSLSGVAQNISAGNFATNLSTNISGALSGIATSLGNAFSSAKGAITSAFSAITDAYKPFKSGVPQDLKALAEEGTKQLDSQNIDNAVASGLAAAKNLATSVTGLQGLPGGEKVLASVVNNAPGSLNTIPGTEQLGSLIKNNMTGLTNNISTSAAGLAKNASSIINNPSFKSDIASATDLLKNNTNSMLGEMSSLLPKDLSAQLGTAISSLSSSGPVEIKMPTIAINTNDRSQFTSQVTSILGNPKVPPPYYGTQEQHNTYIEKEQATLEENAAKLKDQKKRYNEQFQIAKQAKKEWVDAANSLPEGDPQITELKKKFEEEYLKVVKISEELAT